MDVDKTDGNVSVQIKVAMNGGGEKVVVGYKTTKHFAVHKNLDDNAFWDVTHLGTGYRIPSYNETRELAEYRAEAMERVDCVDWSVQSMPEIATQLEKSGVKDICIRAAHVELGGTKSRLPRSTVRWHGPGSDNM